MSILKTLMKIMNNVSNHTPEYASTTSLRDLQALSPYDPCRLPLTLCPCSVGRVEKSKNGINSYGYCFLVAFWYVETRKNIFFGQRKFFVGWNLT